jgi:branched-chain amino acid aminotransferase
MYLWLNGDFVKQKFVDIDRLTQDLYYKAGAFERVRIYNGKIFKLKEHIEQLVYSANILLMNHAFSIANIEQACIDLVARNNIENGYIKLLIFLDSNYSTDAENIVQVMIIGWNRIPSYSDDLTKKKSLNIKFSSIVKPPPRSFPYSTQISGLYLLNDIAKKRAINAGYDDALLFDYRGYSADATSSNFFIVKDGVLSTPTTECCFGGTTRQQVIDIAKENSIEVSERHITKLEVSEADEAFLTGTAIEIEVIKSISDYEYNHNPVTQLLYSKFYQLTQNL